LCGGDNQNKVNIDKCFVLMFSFQLQQHSYASCLGKQSLSFCLASQQLHGHASLQGANSFTE